MSSVKKKKKENIEALEETSLCYVKGMSEPILRGRMVLSVVFFFRSCASFFLCMDVLLAKCCTTNPFYCCPSMYQFVNCGTSAMSLMAFSLIVLENIDSFSDAFHAVTQSYIKSANLVKLSSPTTQKLPAPLEKWVSK